MPSLPKVYWVWTLLVLLSAPYLLGFIQPSGVARHQRSHYAYNRATVHSNRPSAPRLERSRSRSKEPRKLLCEADPPIKDYGNERLQIILARAGLASRRVAENMILDGRVVVNGQIVTRVGSKACAKTDVISVDGKVLLAVAPEARWVAINKPKSLLATLDTANIDDCLLKVIPLAEDLHLQPIGKIPRDCSGLMLLTNERGFINTLSHPSSMCKRRYHVSFEGTPDPRALQEIVNRGLRSDEQYPLRVQQCSLVECPDKTYLDVELIGGASGSIEHLLEQVGCTLIRWKCVQVGPVQLRGMRSGAWKELRPFEVNNLKALCR